MPCPYPAGSLKPWFHPELTAGAAIVLKETLLFAASLNFWLVDRLAVFTAKSGNTTDVRCSSSTTSAPTFIGPAGRDVGCGAGASGSRTPSCVNATPQRDNNASNSAHQ